MKRLAQNAEHDALALRHLNLYHAANHARTEEHSVDASALSPPTPPRRAPISRCGEHVFVAHGDAGEGPKKRAIESTALEKERRTGPGEVEVPLISMDVGAGTRQARLVTRWGDHRSRVA